MLDFNSISTTHPNAYKAMCVYLTEEKRLVSVSVIVSRFNADEYHNRMLYDFFDSKGVIISVWCEGIKKRGSQKFVFDILYKDGEVKETPIGNRPDTEKAALLKAFEILDNLTI